MYNGFLTFLHQHAGEKPDELCVMPECNARRKRLTSVARGSQPKTCEYHGDAYKRLYWKWQAEKRATRKT
jgi:hypothetical protein